MRTDVTKEADLATLVDRTVERFGRLDAVCNNAGFQERRAPCWSSRTTIYAQVFDTNVRFLFNAMRLRDSRHAGDGGGAIVNITSVSGFRNPYPGFSLYNASKAAAISLTRSTALEYAPQGVRINSVAPGPGGDRHDALDRVGRYAGGGRADCRCGGWGIRKRSPWPRSGCCRTRRATSWGTCSAPMAGFWRGSCRAKGTGRVCSGRSRMSDSSPAFTVIDARQLRYGSIARRNSAASTRCAAPRGGREP